MGWFGKPSEPRDVCARTKAPAGWYCSRNAGHEGPCAAYQEVQQRSLPQFPHCDSLILHSPGVCRFCDLHPDWQDLREYMGIAFSDMHQERAAELGLVPCPSTYRRPAEVRDRWGGNVPA